MAKPVAIRKYHHLRAHLTGLNMQMIFCATVLSRDECKFLRPMNYSNATFKQQKYK